MHQPRTSAAGSSPRGRGKRDDTRYRRLRVRLIPARAGKTTVVHAHLTPPWAHPRAGGENRALFQRGYSPLGSSPRGRGKHPFLAAILPPVRLIPARAGKTSTRQRVNCVTWAHPRAGGENALSPRRRGRTRASSPRGRGKRAAQRRLFRSSGLIPARAGKTPFRGAPWRGCAAHPRVGGENDPGGADAIHARGSSPRGRGKRSCNRGNERS